MVCISELLTVFYCFNTTLPSYALNGRNYEHLITAQNHFHVHGSILNSTLLLFLRTCTWLYSFVSTQLFSGSHTAKIKDYEYFMISQNDLQVHGYILLFQCNSSLVTTTASEIIMYIGVLILSLQHSSFLMSHYENKRLRTFRGISESLTGSCPYCIVSTHLFSVTIYERLITAQNYFHVDSIPT